MEHRQNRKVRLVVIALLTGCASTATPFQRYMDCVRDVTSEDIIPTPPGIRAAVNLAARKCDSLDVPEDRKRKFLLQVSAELRDAAGIP